MRKLLFRGKRKDNGEWITGFYAESGEKSYIIVDNGFAVAYVVMKEVYPETVGQYTGLEDRNGVSVFDGDIIAYEEFLTKNKAVVRYGKHIFSGHWQIGFYLEWIGEAKGLYRKDICYWFEGRFAHCRVIGNIHDNPDLLGG